MVSKKAVVLLVILAIVLSIISIAIFIMDSSVKNAYGAGSEKTTDSGQAHVGLIISKPVGTTSGAGE